MKKLLLIPFFFLVSCQDYVLKKEDCYKVKEYEEKCTDEYSYFYPVCDTYYFVEEICK